MIHWLLSAILALDPYESPIHGLLRSPPSPPFALTSLVPGSLAPGATPSSLHLQGQGYLQMKCPGIVIPRVGPVIDFLTDVPSSLIKTWALSLKCFRWVLIGIRSYVQIYNLSSSCALSPEGPRTRDGRDSRRPRNQGQGARSRLRGAGPPRIGLKGSFHSKLRSIPLINEPPFISNTRPGQLPRFPRASGEAWSTPPPRSPGKG